MALFILHAKIHSLQELKGTAASPSSSSPTITPTRLGKIRVAVRSRLDPALGSGSGPGLSSSPPLDHTETPSVPTVGTTTPPPPDTSSTSTRPPGTSPVYQMRPDEVLLVLGCLPPPASSRYFAFTPYTYLAYNNQVGHAKHRWNHS